MAEVGCVMKPTSADEYGALVDFYSEMNGINWRLQDNWLVGDPCMNHWFGVYCNVEA